MCIYMYGMVDINSYVLVSLYILEKTAVLLFTIWKIKHPEYKEWYRNDLPAQDLLLYL